MEKARGLLVFLSLLSFACVSDKAIKTKIDIPNYSPINLGRYDAIIITDFRQKEETPGFNLSQEIVAYLNLELAQRFKGKVSVRPLAWNKEGLTEDKDFWKGQIPGIKSALFLTGDVLYTQEIRKALLEAEKKEIDGPFKIVPKGLSERKVFNLVLNIFLIQAESGEIVYKKEFKETRTYSDISQPLAFAFFEIIPTIKQKFFREVMGEEKSQERYLIKR